MLLQELFRDQDVITVSPDDTIAQATLKMKEEDVGAVLFAFLSRELFNVSKALEPAIHQPV